MGLKLEYYLIRKHPRGGYALVLCYENNEPPASPDSEQYEDLLTAALVAQQSGLANNFRFDAEVFEESFSHDRSVS